MPELFSECTAKINEAKKIDFYVESEFIRTGRRFTDIIFSVKSRRKDAVPSTLSVPQEEWEGMVKDLTGYSDEDWRGLILSEQQRSYFAKKLANYQDGGVGTRFARDYLSRCGQLLIPTTLGSDGFKRSLQILHSCMKLEFF